MLCACTCVLYSLQRIWFTDVINWCTHCILHCNGMHLMITETETSSFWWNFHHWLHWKLSKWQLPVQPVIKISSKWRHFCFIWRHPMEAVSALRALCEGNPPVTIGFPSQRTSNAGFDAFFDIILNKRLNKQSIRQWFETSVCSLWRHCNVGGVIKPWWV